MKRTSTTPVSKGLVTKSMIVALAVMAGLAGPIQMGQTVFADKFDDKISAIQNQINAYSSEEQKLSKQANTLKNKLAILAAQKATIQARIEVNTAKYDELKRNIAANEKKIAENREALGETLADMYVDDSISPLEMLASSDNIGDYVDKQEYRSAIQDNLSETIDEIKKLKKELEKQQADVKTVLNDQKNQRSILANKEQQQQSILAETKGKESSYRNMISDGKGQIEELRQEAAAVRAAINSGYTNGAQGSATSSTNYPFYPNSCSFTNDGYGYFKCQCVSYVAYRLAADPANRGFAGLGNAIDWWDDGRRVGAGDVRGGDVIVWNNGSWTGHVMYVESVSGGTVYFTDFNGFGGALSPGQGSVSASDATSGSMTTRRFR